MSRRVWFAALFVVSLIIMRPAVLPEVTWAQPVVPNVEGPPSGATSPAPINSSFDAEPSDAAKTSVLGKAGIIEPPGWQLAAGGARPVKTGGPSDRSYALLHQDQAVLVSSPFTLSPTTTKFSFSYRFFEQPKDPASLASAEVETPGVLAVSVLSGPNFSKETPAFVQTCSCSNDWTKQWVDVSKWSGETIELKFLRANYLGRPVGIADVATDLLQAKIGRNRRSAVAGDPVDTSNGNFTESMVDIPVIPGKGVPLQFARFYNSNSSYVGNLGPKWTNTYSLSVTRESDNSVTVRYADGKTANFGQPSAPFPSPPVFDAASMGGPSADCVGSGVAEHIVGSGANRILVVGGVGLTNVTYNGSALTQIQGSTFTMFYLLNPPSGAHNISATGCVTYIGLSFSNAAQQAPTGVGDLYGCCWSNLTIGASISATLNDMIADFTWPNLYGLESPTKPQTLRIGTFSDSILASTQPGHESTTEMDWDRTYAENDAEWAHGIVAIAGTGDSSMHYETLVSPPGNFDTLTANADGSYTLATPAQTRYNFDLTNGRLTSIQDRNSNTTSVSYNGSGVLSTVTDAGGRTLTFASSGGKLTSVTDPLGRVAYFNTSGTNLADTTDVRGGHTYYTYNSGGSLLLTKQNALGNQEFSNTYDSASRVVKQLRVAGWTNTYTCFYYGTWPSYSDSNCPTISPAPASGETIVVDARGYKTKYAFDTTFRTYSATNALSGVSTRVFDTNNNVTCATDQLGNKTALTYDSAGNITHIIDSLNTNSSCQLKSGGVQSSITYTAMNDPSLVTDVLGRQTAYSYDTAGNVTQVDSKDASSVVKHRSCFTVNSAGQVMAATQSTTLTNCTGNTTGYSYDGYGNVTAVTNPRFYGQQTPPKTTITYDLGGRKLTVTNELSHVTTFTYNNFNEVLTAKDNLNDTVTYTYGAVGNKTTAKDPLNNTTTFNYDNLNRLTSVVDALSGTTTYVYDANDNRTSVTNARGKVSSAVYDALNRVTSATDPNNRTASLQYDAASRLTQRTDARGLVTKYFYDAASRLTSLEHWTGSTKNETYTYTFNAVGSRTQMVGPTGTTTYSYDALNRPTSITFPGSKTVAYTYDNLGNRSRITYADSKYVDYTYDAANNLSTVTDWLGKQTTYGYNNAGALAWTQLPSSIGLGTVEVYDAADRLTQVKNGTMTAGPAVNPMLVASFDFASSDTWTPPTGMTEAFDVSSKAAPNSGGEAIEGAYAVQSGTGATGTRTATAAGDADYGNAHLLALRPASGSSIAFRAAASAGVDSYTSLTINKPSGTTQGDVMVASIGLRPTSAPITPPSGWTLVSRFNNEGNSNMLAVYIKVAGASEPSSYTWTISCCAATASAGGIQSFSGVDNANPIVAEAGQTTPSGLTHTAPSIDTSAAKSAPVYTTPLYEFSYTLNADGNRTQVIDASGTTTYGYDALQRLTSVTYPGPTTDSYTYDAVGNRLTKNSASYTYDDVDQLTTVASTSYGYDANGNQASRASDSFSWDHENRLTSATVGGTQTTYTYNGDGLRQTRASGGTTVSYIWDVTTGAMLQDGTYTYVYGLGLISTTDGSGTQAYYLKDGLGSTVALVNGSGTATATYAYDAFGGTRTHTGASTEYNFTGEDNDPTGLEYLRARYYDNGTGRFTSTDPMGSGYSYASGNPVNMVDPTGLFTMCPHDPVWGDICFDSTQVGLGACNPATGDCSIYLGDGSAPGNTAGLVDVAAGDACVFADGSLHHCYGPDNSDFTDAELEAGLSLQHQVFNALTMLHADTLTPNQLRVVRLGLLPDGGSVECQVAKYMLYSAIIIAFISAPSGVGPIATSLIQVFATSVAVGAFCK